jgi:hypothetical protein
MIFQSSMGLKISRCDIPSGAIQGWACPKASPSWHIKGGVFYQFLFLVVNIVDSWGGTYDFVRSFMWCNLPKCSK